MDESTPAAPAEPSSPLDVVRSALPGILSRSKIVLSPYPFGMSDDDNMRVLVVNSVAGVVVNVHTRRILKDLTPTADTPSFTPTSDRTVFSTDIPLAGGYVTNLSVFASGVAPVKGQCFVIVQMIRGLGVSATVLGTLLAGYITATQPVGWPGSPIESSTEGEGAPRTLQGTAPAANAPISETVPSGARWLIQGIRCTMTTPGGGRPIKVRYLDPSGNTIGGSMSSFNANVAPSVNEFIGTAGYPQQYTNVVSPELELFSALPYPVTLEPGGKFTLTYTGSFQFSAPTYLVREWQEAA